MKVNGIELKWLGHSGFLIKRGKVIYIDPYNIKDGMEKADIILITHSHHDHCSYLDMKKIVKNGTRIVASADCQSKVTRFEVPIKIELIEPGRELDLGEIKVYAFPAYNIDKSFHPQDESWMGYVVKVGETVIYHSGDTDLIPEMQKLTGYKQSGKEFIALLPVGGRFTMTAEEAAEAARLIKPTLAIPMHWGAIVGSEDDAKEFVELCKENGIRAEILEKE
ncbi:MAG: MBL fold metallo-hydrolase [Nanoarchaeota archaeon]|nr:MBL fold metallo-hydrolase [Nanoarchaeota archaeon]MBU1501282.1 MBL fold metallo-hydrolase [Nanoarchaeota archaeon]MBU2459081.1 MBL fold metallo-hydrolase [Nanoarchaeota archaeon]